MEKTRSRPKSQKWCNGCFKRVREMLVSVWSKICQFFFFFPFLSFSPPLLKLYLFPPISCSLLPSMKNASFIWGLGLACLELIESTPLKYFIKWWTDQSGDPEHCTACDWKCFSSMFAGVWALSWPQTVAQVLGYRASSQPAVLPILPRVLDQFLLHCGAGSSFSLPLQPAAQTGFLSSPFCFLFALMNGWFPSSCLQWRK